MLKPKPKENTKNPFPNISKWFKADSLNSQRAGASTDVADVAVEHKKSKKKNSVIVTGLDIGTTKICAIIGEVDADENLTILGIGIEPSRGMKKGLVVDIPTSAYCIHNAIKRAEKMAKIEVKDVFVGIAGGHVHCMTVEKLIMLSNKTPRHVNDRDVNRLLKHTRITSIPIDREIILAEPLEFYTDDGPKQNLLGGVMTKKLGLKALLVTAAVVSTQNMIKSIKMGGCNITELYLQPLASGLALLNDRMREAGVILIDIGGGTSDIALYFNDNIQYTATIPYAGDNVTADVKEKYGVTFQEAENLKKRYGKINFKKSGVKEIIEERGTLGQKITIDREEFCHVVSCRFEEILQLCKDNIMTTPYFDKIRGGVILTGGSSLIEGIDELTSRIFGLTTIVAEPRNFKGNAGVISSPIYSTAVGLVYYGARFKRHRYVESSNLFRRIINGLKDTIDWY